MLGVGWDGPLGPGPGGDGPSGDGTVPDRPPTDAERAALAVLAAVEGVGPIHLERLLWAFTTAEEVLRAALQPGGPGVLIAATRPPEGLGNPMPEATADAIAIAARRPEATLRAIAAAGLEALLLGDPGYPSRLRSIDLPPRVLYVQGPVAALEAAASVAVVGTRRPTDPGRRTAARIGAALARAEALVVSGLAIGIDGAAHAAVVAEGRPTVAVIGSGHSRLFPRAHDRLAAAIVDAGGAVISEHPPGTLPHRGTFPRRNRLISGLADAVVVVEAPARSGALLTAAWALEQGRECFFVPGAIDAPQSAGCLAWLRDYAGTVRVVAGIPQLLEDLGLAASAAFPAPAPSSGGARPPSHAVRGPGPDAARLQLSTRDAAVADGLIRGGATADELVAITRLPIAAVLASLTYLEEHGLVVGWYGRYRPAGGLALAEAAGPAERADEAFREPAA